MTSLIDRQREILAFIAEREHAGAPVSFRELEAKFGVTRNAVNDHLVVASGWGGTQPGQTPVVFLENDKTEHLDLKLKLHAEFHALPSGEFQRPDGSMAIPFGEAPPGTVAVVCMVRAPSAPMAYCSTSLVAT